MKKKLAAFALNSAGILPDLARASPLSFRASVYGTYLYTKTNFQDEMKYYDLGSYCVHIIGVAYLQTPGR